MLDVRDLQVSYRHTVRALGGLSLHVEPSSTVALLGPNGAGKTTLLKAIAGLIPLEGGRVDGGDILYQGAGIVGRAPHLLARSGITYVQEGRNVFTGLTVQENLAAATHALRGRGQAPDFDRVYDLFPSLAERRRQPAGYLSGGERQMLSIGRAIVTDPKLMLLDEPSLGLAPKMVETVFAIIRRIVLDWDVSILLADQNIFAALEISQYGYVLEQGRITVEGEPEKLLGDSRIEAAYLGVKQAGGA